MRPGRAQPGFVGLPVLKAGCCCGGRAAARMRACVRACARGGVRVLAEEAARAAHKRKTPPPRVLHCGVCAPLGPPRHPPHPMRTALPPGDHGRGACVV